MNAYQLFGRRTAWSAALVLVAGAATAQTVYKSVGEDGTVTYTDRPVASEQLETVEGLDIVATDIDQVNAGKAEAKKQAKYDDAADDIRDNQAAEDAELQAALADQREAACRAANARFEKYTNARRLYRETPDGDREYLNDSELDAERADAARAVDELCG